MRRHASKELRGRATLKELARWRTEGTSLRLVAVAFLVLTTGGVGSAFAAWSHRFCSSWPRSQHLLSSRPHRLRVLRAAAAELRRGGGNREGTEQDDDAGFWRALVRHPWTLVPAASWARPLAFVTALLIMAPLVIRSRTRCVLLPHAAVAARWLLAASLLRLLSGIIARLDAQGNGKARGLRIGSVGGAVAPDDIAARFADVAGVDAAKEQVQEVVEILRDPSAFAAFGARVPRGVLLIGPPGCGKTFLARACAADAGVPFFGVAATEFVELFVGAGAARVRQLFDRARRAAPSILFIDEIDAISCARGTSSHMAGAAQEAEQTLNQLLVSMDGLDARESRDPILVVAACNRPEMLDEALLRPGRFDRVVRVDPPDADGRLQILLTHIRLNRVPLASDVDTTALGLLAKRCEGLGGAALEAIVNEAAIRAARTHQRLGTARRLEAAINGDGVSEPPKREVAIEHFEAALDALMRSFDG